MFGDLRICLILITAHAECGLLCFRHIGNHQIYHFKKIGCSHNFLSVAETAVPFLYISLIFRHYMLMSEDFENRISRHLEKISLQRLHIRKRVSAVPKRTKHVMGDIIHILADTNETIREFAHRGSITHSFD